MIASAMRDAGINGSIITIDIRRSHQLFRDTPIEYLISFKEGLSTEVPIGTNNKFDLIVLDSDHAYETIIKEVIRFEPMLRLDGYMLFHDSVIADAVAITIAQLRKTKRFELVTLPSTRALAGRARPPGITVVRKIRASKDPYDIEFIEQYRGVTWTGKGRQQTDPTWLIDTLSDADILQDA
jgi:hypothetical protein